MTAVNLTVNGRAVAADVAPRQHLGDFVREDLLLTGTHLGCEHGVCGACTVLIGGAPARACIAFTAALDGAAVTTIEGLADDPVMAELRAAFSAEHGLQCGFCTPGMMIMARDIVLRRPGADPETIRHDLAGNLCRCTGYVGIVRAIARVAEARRHLPPVVTRGSAVEPAASPSPLTLPIAPPRPGAAPETRVAARGGEGSPADEGPALPEPTFEALRNPVTLDQVFAVPAPRETVWSYLTVPERVVACLPGARLTAPSDGRLIRAEMAVKLGPLQATFGGSGVMATDLATWSGSIEGAALDRRSATRAQARLSFHLDADDPEATTVRVAVAYALQGPLAQMSRGALARDLAGRLTETFAANLAAVIAGVGPAAQGPTLDAGALLLGVLKGWLARVFRRR